MTGIFGLIAFLVSSTSSTEVGAVLTNRLAGAASPYLRGAAAQPVAWQPWGQEAFTLARTLDRLILLDIGAIWCHWCHVMDEETYGDPEVARLINAHFVAIKVDRDERPDIDARYQKAVQVLSWDAGWPLTVFMTPDGEVFHGGGTFFPDDRFGRPGFKTLLPLMAEAYRDRKETVLGLARSLREALAASEAEALRTGDLSRGLVQATAGALVASFDAAHGGFGEGAKFPVAGPIELALRLYAESDDRQMLRIATRTLDAMANGGIHDHVGGGFHGYAVDRAWQNPRFEKLDYVNAQLLLAYLHAYQATRDARYREVAEGIIAYTNRVLSDQQRGGFHADQDADMRGGDDGGYYTWSLPEVKAAVALDEADVVARYYDISEQGNMLSAPGRNVLRVVRTPEEIASALSAPPSQVRALLRSGTARLLAARDQRATPVVDRRVFADRNALMISAYFEAYKVLGREDAKAFASKSLEFLLTNLRAGDGTLYHALSDGRAHVPGFLKDYVWVAQALLDAFQVTGATRHLTTARDVMDRALSTFWDPAGGAFVDLPHDPVAVGPLKLSVKSFEDTDMPSSNATAALVLDQLAYLTNVDLYRQRAEEVLRAFAGTAARSGRFAAGYALALDLHLRPPPRAVIFGSQSDPRTSGLWRAALAAFRPGKIVAAYDPAQVKAGELPPPVAAAMRNAQTIGAPQAYVCVETACSLPTSDPEVVATLVRTFRREGPQAK